MQETDTGARRRLRVAAGIAALAAAPLALFLPAPPEGDSLAALSRAVVAASLALGLLAGGLAALSRAPLRHALGWRPTAPGLGGRDGVLLVAGTVALSHCIDLAITQSGLREQSVLTRIDRAVAGAEGGELWLAFGVLAVLPAVAEETLFRGVLFGRLRVHVGVPAAAIASSLAFGALHGEWVQGGGAALLGLYLAAVASRSGGIGLPVLCHLANNAAAVAAAAWGATPQGSGGPGAWLVAGLLAAVVVLAALRRLRDLDVAD